MAALGMTAEAKSKAPHVYARPLREPQGQMQFSPTGTHELWLIELPKAKGGDAVSFHHRLCMPGARKHHHWLEAVCCPNSPDRQQA